MKIIKGKKGIRHEVVIHAYVPASSGDGVALHGKLRAKDGSVIRLSDAEIDRIVAARAAR